jgi:hypothetical protein
MYCLCLFETPPAPSTSLQKLPIATCYVIDAAHCHDCHRCTMVEGSV